MGRTKLYKEAIIQESHHMGTIEPSFLLEDGSEIYCLQYINGAIKKYGWRKDIYLMDLFKYLEGMSLDYIQQYFKDDKIGDKTIKKHDRDALLTIEPIYIITPQDRAFDLNSYPNGVEFRLRNMELAFIYGAINKYDKDDSYDKIELLQYIIKSCQSYFDKVSRSDKLRKSVE